MKISRVLRFHKKDGSSFDIDLRQYVGLKYSKDLSDISETTKDDFTLSISKVLTGDFSDIANIVVLKKN